MAVIPEKVIFWLTDFTVEVEGFLPPENTRIVPLGKNIPESILENDRLPEPDQLRTAAKP